MAEPRFFIKDKVQTVTAPGIDQVCEVYDLFSYHKARLPSERLHYIVFFLDDWGDAHFFIRRENQLKRVP